MTRMFVGDDQIPGLLEAVQRAMPDPADAVVEAKIHPPGTSNWGMPGVLMASDKWHGPQVTIEEVLASVEAEGFTGPLVANHVAWLCKTDPRVVQRGITKLQRDTEQQLLQKEASNG